MLKIASRCRTPEQFIAAFRPLCSPTSIFIITSTPKEVGAQVSFRLTLETGTPMLSGAGEIVDSFDTGKNRYGQPGMRIRFKDLDSPSRRLLDAIVKPMGKSGNTRMGVVPPPAPRRLPNDTEPAPPPLWLFDTLGEAEPLTSAQKTPIPDFGPRSPITLDELGAGTPASDFILPANPFSAIPDQCLIEHVECTVWTLDCEGGSAGPPAEEDEEPSVELVFGRLESEPAAVSPVLPQSAVPSMTTPAGSAALGADKAPAYEPVPPEPVDTGEPLEVPKTKAGRLVISHVAVAALGVCVGYAVCSGSSVSGSSTSQFRASPVAAMPAASPQKPPAVRQERPGTPTKPATPPETETIAATPPETGTIVAPTKCRLRVATAPADAVVLIDGREYGPSPVDEQVPCGSLLVAARRARYVDATKRVELSVGATDSVELHLLRPMHRLRVLVRPGKANVVVNGRSAGTSPVSITVPGFERAVVTVSKPGYQSLTSRVYVSQPNTDLKLALRPIGTMPIRRPR
jgi:hypothetical protein